MFWFKAPLNSIPLQTFTFQYIICFGSSHLLWKLQCRNLISIHHMFWFKLQEYCYIKHWTYFNTSYVLVQVFTILIAIFQNLYFNTSYVLVQESLFVLAHLFLLISIHHMFWFKEDGEIKVVALNKFQYIICFGSSLLLE